MAILGSLMNPYKKYMKLKRVSAGFTLIELMITVAIVGILVSIAYPNYQDSIMKSRRVDAQGALMGFANAMERYYTVNNTYPAAGTAGIYAATSPVDGGTAYYNLSISVSSNSAYQIQAVPTGVQANDQCGTLSLDHVGTRLPSNCW
jgi:type IV pilus assembly protein PilE